MPRDARVHSLARDCIMTFTNGYERFRRKTTVILPRASAAAARWPMRNGIVCKTAVNIMAICPDAVALSVPYVVPGRSLHIEVTARAISHSAKISELGNRYFKDGACGTKRAQRYSTRSNSVRKTLFRERDVVSLVDARLLMSLLFRCESIWREAPVR